MKYVSDCKEIEEGNKDRSLLDHCSENEIREKSMVLDYMCNAKFLDAVRCGHVFDYVTNQLIGITNREYTDGEFFWTEEDRYHFDHYNMELDPSFVEKAIRSTVAA